MLGHAQKCRHFKMAEESNSTSSTSKVIQEESRKRRLRRQWDLLSQRAEQWFNDAPQAPSLVLLYLKGDQIMYKAPRHMEGFCENPDVLNAFKAAALGRPVNLQSSTEEVENPSETIEIPYKDAKEYTWDILVFLIPEILRLHGIHGKNGYNIANKPAWWPEGLRFCSPNSSKEGKMF